MIHNKKDRANTRRGGIAVWVVLSLAVIIAVVAFTLDGGRMMDERRRAQSTADASALAAATVLYEQYDSSDADDARNAADQTARKIATANGFGGTTSSVTVNIPPTQGAFAGKTDYVEVVVEKKLPRTFAQVFTQSTTTVKARAVARGRPMKLGIIALKRSGPATLHVDGIAAAAIGNDVIVNSSDAKALQHDGIGILQASRFDIVGDYVSSGILIGKVNTGVAPTPDPLRYLPTPNPSDYFVRSGKKLVLNTLGLTVLQPGIYQGGIEIGGAATVVLQPGVYILQGGGLKVEGLATATGLGVMLYSTGDSPIDIVGSGKVVLTPPLTGTYRGITLFQNRSSTQPISIKGILSTNIGGAIYAAKSHVTINGGVALGLAAPGGAIIADTIHMTGIGNVDINLAGADPPAPDIRIVE